MNLKRIKNGISTRVFKHINERRGWKTSRKIIVIESDDWGSIRMPSKEVYDKSLIKGFPVDFNPYEKFDSLESEEDLVFLFDVLSGFNDIHDNPVCLTANTLVANPDFEAIKNNCFEKYAFETIDKTFRRFPRCSESLNLWWEGDEKGIFKIQYHGREHLNVSLFMKDLKNNNSSARWGFENHILGGINKEGRNSYVNATRSFNYEDKIEKRDIILEGLEIFKSMHKKDSESFIAPNYRWHPEWNIELKKKGVLFLQGGLIQLVPFGDGKDNRIFHYIGEENVFDQIYLTRNCLFEPSLMPKVDSVSNCLKQIHKAFKLGKPAIISSHRLNYIGSINKQNRDKNLNSLKNLLYQISNTWPDVEFLSSDQLGHIINQSVSRPNLKPEL